MPRQPSRAELQDFFWDVDHYRIAFPGRRVYLDFSESPERRLHFLVTLVVAELMPPGSKTYFVPYLRFQDRLSMLLARQGIQHRLSAQSLFDAWKHRLRPPSMSGCVLARRCPYEVVLADSRLPLPLRAPERAEKGSAIRVYERYLPDYARILETETEGAMSNDAHTGRQLAAARESLARRYKVELGHLADMFDSTSRGTYAFQVNTSRFRLETSLSKAETKNDPRVVLPEGTPDREVVEEILTAAVSYLKRARWYLNPDLASAFRASFIHDALRFCRDDFHTFRLCVDTWECDVRDAELKALRLIRDQTPPCAFHYEMLEDPSRLAAFVASLASDLSRSQTTLSDVWSTVHEESRGLMWLEASPKYLSILCDRLRSAFRLHTLDPHVLVPLRYRMMQEFALKAIERVDSEREHLADRMREGRVLAKRRRGASKE